MGIKALNRKLYKEYGGRVTASPEDNCIVLRGCLDKWEDVVAAGLMCAKPHSKCHVVNDIVFTGAEEIPMRMPELKDTALDGDRPDVLIIGVFPAALSQGSLRDISSMCCCLRRKQTLHSEPPAAMTARCTRALTCPEDP